MDISTYKPDQVNLTVLKRKSEAGVNASITRLGVLSDENTVDPYDNTPSFAKNKELTFKARQTGYTNSLLEKILETQNNKDAWAATQQYHKKSLEYLEKISSKMNQLVPDKREEYEELQKSKARCSAITKALLSGDAKGAMKMISRGIMDAATPYQLQMVMSFAQSALQFSNMEEAISQIGNVVSGAIIKAMPKSVGFTLEQMRDDLPSVIDAQFVQLYNTVNKFNKKTKGGNVASRSVLEILHNMGINTQLGESVDNITKKNKDYKERMSFDRAFYETVTNGIPQQLARIEQAIRGGYIYHWDAQKGTFKRMDSKAFNDVLTPDTARVRMNKDAAYNFMNDIADNYELNGAAFKAGITVKYNKNGNRVIDNELITEVFGIKWHDLLTRHDIAAKLTSMNKNTTVEEISNMVSSVVYRSSWDGYGFNQLGGYKRADVELADKEVAKKILKLLMQMRSDYALKRAIINQAKEAQDSVADYEERLSYDSGYGIDIKAAIQSGATNMSGALGGKRGSSAKSSISKRLQSVYNIGDKKAEYAENKAYTSTKIIKAINEITGTSDRYGFGNDAKLSNDIDLALKKKFLDVFKSPTDYEAFINRCIDDKGNLDSDKFTKEISRILSSSRNDELKDIYKRLKVGSLGKSDRKTLNNDLAGRFYDSVSNNMRETISLDELADSGSTLIADILSNESTSLKKLGITVGGVTLFTKKFLKKNGMVTNPVAGTILGAMLSAGAVFVQHTKYFQTITGQDKNAYDSDGNLTNQERVMTDLLTNKVGPLLAGLGVGKGVSKLFKKLGPIGRLVGVPAAIVTGVSAFAASAFAKNTFGDALAGEKQADGTRQGKSKFSRLVRTVMKSVGMGKFLDAVDADADIAESQGMKLSEYQKSLKNGGLYREGKRDIKIESNGGFTITGEVADANGNYSTKSASGTIKTDKLRTKVTELKVVLNKLGKSHRQLSQEDLEFLSTGEMEHVVTSMKAGANVDAFIKKIADRSPKLGEYVRWYLKKAQLESEIDGDIKAAAVSSFDNAIKDSELKSLDSGHLDNLRDRYVTEAIKTFKNDTLRSEILPDTNRPDSTAGKLWEGAKSVLTEGKIGIFNKLAKSKYEIFSAYGKDKLNEISEADKDKYAIKNALAAGQGLDGLFDENGIIKNSSILDADGNYVTESGEIINEESGEIVNLTEGAFRTSTARLQTTMADSLTKIANQIGRLFYDDLPVIMRGGVASSGSESGEPIADDENYINILGGNESGEPKYIDIANKLAKKVSDNPILSGIAKSYVSKLSPELTKDPAISSIIGNLTGDMPHKDDGIGIDIDETSLGDTINEINTDEVTSNLRDVPVAPIPTVNVLDIPDMANVDNLEQYREARSAVTSLIATLPPDQRQVYQNAFNAYDRMYKKPNTKKENEQSERIEEKQEKVLDMQIMHDTGKKPGDLNVGDKAIDIADALKSINGEGSGFLGDMNGSALESFLGGDLGGSVGGIFGKVLPWLGSSAAYISAAALVGYGAYKVYKYTKDYLSMIPEKLRDLFDWNQETEGAEIDDEGNVVKEAETHSVNNAVHYFKDAIYVVKGATEYFKNMPKSIKTLGKVFKTVGGSLLHPVKTIKNLIGKFKANKETFKAAGKAAINGVKKFAGAVAGVVAKICDYIANCKIINKLPGVGPAISSFFTKLSGKLGSFSTKISEMLGPFFKKAGQQGAKEAGKKGLKKIPVLNLVLLAWSALDGWRKAAAYLGLMPSNVKNEKDLKVKPDAILKFNVAFFKAMYDNFISMAGSYFGSAVAIATLGVGTLGTAAISIICGVLEAIFHNAISFPSFLEKVMGWICNKEKLKEARLINKNINPEDGEEEQKEQSNIEDRVQGELTNAINEENAELAEENDVINELSNIQDEEEVEVQDNKSVLDKLDEQSARVKAELNANKEGKTSVIKGLLNKTKSLTKTAISVSGIGLAYRAGKKALSWLSGNSTSLPTYSGSDYDNAVSTLISNAESQVGYQSGYNSNNMYAGEVGAANNQAWCSTFQDWVFQKTFGKDAAKGLLGGSANQPSTWERAKKMINIGSYVENDGKGIVKPQPGDLVFFDFASGRKRHNNPTNHIGLVTQVNADGTVDTIEGNTSMQEGNQTTGGRVAKKNRRYVGGGSIVGFARPDWSQIGAKTDSITGNTVTANTSGSADGKLKPGEPAGFMDTLGSIERGLETVHRGTRAVGTIKRSGEAIKRTMAHTKEANKGKSFWEKARNNTRAVASTIGNVAQVTGAIGHVLPNSQIGNVARQVSDTMNVADRYARTAARQMDMVGSVITNVQTKTAGGIIDAVQTSGHILSSGFGGLIKGMDVNTRKLDQMCNTGDRTIRVLEEIKGILGRGNFIADNASTASVS